MRTSRKRHSRESLSSIAESFSLGNSHNSQIQLQDTPGPGWSSMWWPPWRFGFPTKQREGCAPPDSFLSFLTGISHSWVWGF